MDNLHTPQPRHAGPVGDAMDALLCLECTMVIGEVHLVAHNEGANVGSELLNDDVVGDIGEGGSHRRAKCGSVKGAKKAVGVGHENVELSRERGAVHATGRGRRQRRWRRPGWRRVVRMWSMRMGSEGTYARVVREVLMGMVTVGDHSKVMLGAESLFLCLSGDELSFYWRWRRGLRRRRWRRRG